MHYIRIQLNKIQKMQHLFTPIGISIFINVLHWAKENNHPNLSTLNQAFSDCLRDAANQKQEDLLLELVTQRFALGKELFKNTSNYQAHNNPDTFKLSAEIQSINQLLIHSKWKGTTFHLHLLATDSQTSPLAAQLIQDYYESHPYIKKVVIKTISGLQINHSDQFKDNGIQALINYIHSTKKQFISIKNKQVKLEGLLNITSGYKGITPILTIVGQLLNIPLVYLYERSDNLIEIPPLPLSFDWTKLEIFQYCFAKLNANPITNATAESNQYSLDALQDKKIQRFIYREMIQNALIKEVIPDKSYQITFLGRLLRHHIEEVYPAGTKAFGLAFEFLFFELMVSEPFQYDQIIFNQVIHHKIIKKREFDLELRSPDLDKEQSGICEICSYGQLADFKGDRKYYFLKQLRRQIKMFKTQSKRPWCYLLLIYSFEGMSNWDQLNDSLLDISNKLNTVGIVRFRTFGVSLPLEVSSKNNKNPYSNLYQKKLTFDKSKWRLGNKEEFGNPWLWLEELNDWKTEI